MLKISCAFCTFHFFTTSQTGAWLQHGTRAPTAAGTACSAGSQRRWRAPGTIVTCWWSVKPRATEWKAWVFTLNLVGFLPVFTMAPFNFGITGLAHWLTSLRNMKVVRFVEFVSTFHNLYSSLVEMTTRSRFGTTSCEGVSHIAWPFGLHQNRGVPWWLSLDLECIWWSNHSYLELAIQILHRSADRS